MENNFLTGIKAGVSAFIAALTAIWGWFGWLAFAWIMLMLADWLVGSAAALKRGEWSSVKLREGAWHKGGQIVIVCVAVVADWLIGGMLANIPSVTLPFDYNVLLSPVVICWYIFGELGSLAEHGISMGAPVPMWLIKLLDAGEKAMDAAGDKLLGSDEEPPA